MSRFNPEDEHDFEDQSLQARRRAEREPAPGEDPEIRDYRGTATVLGTPEAAGLGVKGPGPQVCCHCGVDCTWTWHNPDGHPYCSLKCLEAVGIIPKAMVPAGLSGDQCKSCRRTLPLEHNGYCDRHACQHSAPAQPGSGVLAEMDASETYSLGGPIRFRQSTETGLPVFVPPPKPDGYVCEHCGRAYEYSLGWCAVRDPNAGSTQTMFHGCSQPCAEALAAAPDPMADFDAFIADVRAKMSKGRKEYGDVSFSRDPRELLRELQNEAKDFAGWGYVLWVRLERALAAIEAINGAPTGDVFKLRTARELGSSTIKPPGMHNAFCVCARCQGDPNAPADTPEKVERR